MHIKRSQMLAVVIAFVIGVGIVIYALMAGSRPQAIKSVLVTTMNLQQELEASGTVRGAHDVELSFERSGKIASVSADVGQAVSRGQTLATLDTTDLNAELLGAEAELKTEELKLQGLNPNNTSGSDVQTAINNNRSNVVDKLTDGYIKVDTALSTNVDVLFSNPKNYPVFGIAVNQSGSTYTVSTDVDTEINLNTERRDLISRMTEWNTLNQNLTTDQNIAVASEKAEETMMLTQKLLTDIASALNASVGSDATFQTIVAGYKTSIATARVNVDTALTNLRTAEQTYASAEAPASAYAVKLQQASIETAQASVDAASSAVSQAIIQAPFAGVITEQNAKVGQIASPSVPVIHLISANNLQVETYLSEADIGKVSSGMPARISLDSYGPQKTWTAKVVSVGAGQSLINGVNAYDVVLQFDENDPEIKSGMNANVYFEISQKNNVVAVPQQAIIQKDTASYVTLDKGNGIQQQQPVTTGIVGSNGYVEIVSGLAPGDHIITFTTQ